MLRMYIPRHLLFLLFSVYEPRERHITEVGYDHNDDEERYDDNDVKDDDEENYTRRECKMASWERAYWQQQQYNSEL